MKALLLYPRFPQTFWSYDRFHANGGAESSYSAFRYPYSCCTAQDWEVQFYDRNVNCETDADWVVWHVILSAMLAQKPDFHELIRAKVVVPYPTSVPQDALNSGANY